MKIAIAAWGTTGDVYPVLALAERLLQREHHVRVCAPSIYKDKILDIGADFFEVGVPFDLAEFHQTMDTVIAMRDPMAPLLLIAKEGILRRGEKWYNDCLTAMKGYDLAICHSISGEGPRRLADALRLDELRVSRRGPDVILLGYRQGCLPELSRSVGG